VADFKGVVEGKYAGLNGLAQGLHRYARVVPAYAGNKKPATVWVAGFKPLWLINVYFKSF
jgi:hypothetical protein